MVERNPAMVETSRSEWRLAARDPIAITDFTNGIVPPRPDVEVNPGMYESLGSAPLAVFSATNSEGEQETIMVGPSLQALEVNGLLYFAAPTKFYGFDRNDIIDDWTALYQDPKHQNRRAAHATMPGWAQFEKSRRRILGVLRRMYDASGDLSQDKHDVIIPVLRWKTDAEGNNRILLEPPDEKLKHALQEKLPKQIRDKDRLDGGMGLMYLAAYSPQQTQWPIEDRYAADSRSSRKQDIGPAQILAYAYREVAREQKNPNSVPEDRDLQRSPLLTGLEQYARTGEVRTIGIVEVKKQDSWVVRQARSELWPYQQPVLDELVAEGSELPEDPSVLIRMVKRIYFDRKDNEAEQSKNHS